MALMQLLNAGVWFLYPWLIVEMALPLHPEDTALQPLLLRVMVYFPCWLRGTWLSSCGGLMALKSLRRSVNMTAAASAILLNILVWIIFCTKINSSSNLFEFVTTEWLFR